MKSFIENLILISSICFSMLACSTSEPPVSKPYSLFDGKTFAGWEGNLEYFRIENGVIVAGRLDKGIPHNEFLCTEKEYADFELTMKFKVSDLHKVNAGVQIRSKRIPGSSEVRGYQADIGQIFWGNLYDESRRRVILAGADTTQMFQIVNMEGWNDYKILCEGNRVQLWINGVQTVDYTEPDDTIEQKGIIGLQIHSGPPGEASYKDIYIRELGG